MPMWFSSARCSAEGCEFKLGFSPDLSGVADKAKQHKHETGHTVVVEDRKKDATQIG